MLPADRPPQGSGKGLGRRPARSWQHGNGSMTGRSGLTDSATLAVALPVKPAALSAPLHCPFGQPFNQRHAALLQRHRFPTVQHRPG